MTEEHIIESSESDLDILEKEEYLIELDIIKYPNKILSHRSEDITEDWDPTDFVRDLFYTMKLNGAVSIAAPSVHVLKRLILINIDEPIVMINPTIISKSKETEEIEEGLLSIPGFFYKIKRYSSITVAYRDSEGNHIQSNATGLIAMTIQHEIDLLNGKIFIDKLSPISKLMNRKKIKKHLKTLGTSL